MEHSFPGEHSRTLTKISVKAYNPQETAFKLQVCKRNPVSLFVNCLANNCFLGIITNPLFFSDRVAKLVQTHNLPVLDSCLLGANKIIGQENNGQR